MIELEHVSKSFGKLQALRDVSLCIERGERVAFVGSNGSGKTTLLRAILGLVRVRGRVLVGGVDVAKHPEQALRGVAYIPQIAPPLDAPVREVVHTISALRGIAPAEIEQRSLRLGLDLKTCEHKRFRDLSGGMKQKLLAAAALAVSAPITICDEPTANLDAAARASFFEQLQEQSEQRILILCSHRIEEVRQLVQRVIELRDGRIDRDILLKLRGFAGDSEAKLHSADSRRLRDAI